MWPSCRTRVGLEAPSLFPHQSDSHFYPHPSSSSSAALRPFPAWADPRRSLPSRPVQSPRRRPHLSPSAADAEAVSMATPAAASSPLRRGLSSPGLRGNPTTAEEGRRRQRPLLLSTDYPGPPSVPRSPSSGSQYVSLQRALTFIQLIYSGLT